VSLDGGRSSTGIIRLHRIPVHGRHGVYDFERHRGQTFIVDVTLTVDIGKAVGSDDLAETVDYGAVYHQVTELVSGPPFSLIEALAATLAQRLLQSHPRLLQVEVTVHKPQAPLPGPIEDVSVTVSLGGLSSE